MRGREVYSKIRPAIILCSGLARILPWFLRYLIFVFLRHAPTKCGIAFRYILLRTLLKKAGENIAVFDGVYLFAPAKMTIGNHVSIHEMCYIDASGGLTIGNEVAIAHNVTIMTTSHDYEQVGYIKDAQCCMASVEIGNDVWIGAGVRVLAGVHIGNHVVIGAGSVVNRSIPENSLAVGVPAKVIRSLQPKDRTFS